MRHLFCHFPPCTLSFTLSQQIQTVFQLHNHLIILLHQQPNLIVFVPIQRLIPLPNLNRCQLLANQIQWQGNALGNQIRNHNHDRKNQSKQIDNRNRILRNVAIQILTIREIRQIQIPLHLQILVQQGRIRRDIIQITQTLIDERGRRPQIRHFTIHRRIHQPTTNTFFNQPIIRRHQQSPIRAIQINIRVVIFRQIIHQTRLILIVHRINIHFTAQLRCNFVRLLPQTILLCLRIIPYKIVHRHKQHHQKRRKHHPRHIELQTIRNEQFPLIPHWHPTAQVL